MEKARMTTVTNKQTHAICCGYVLQNSENSETTISKVIALMGKLDYTELKMCEAWSCVN